MIKYVEHACYHNYVQPSTHILNTLFICTTTSTTRIPTTCKKKKPPFFDSSISARASQVIYTCVMYLQNLLRFRNFNLCKFFDLIFLTFTQQKNKTIYMRILRDNK